MPEIVIVISDLYLPVACEAPASLPGLDRIATFGEQRVLEHGWRGWLARWIGREDLADMPPSVVASESPHELMSWMATPVHLAAGLTTLHFDARGILRLTPDEQQTLALDFERSFHGLRLMSLESGEFLLLQPRVPAVTTTEPARIAGGHVADALPKGEGASQLRRLGAEIEMWLHEHPVNLSRASRNQLTISTLWIWGGGTGSCAARRAVSGLPRAFGSDSTLQGLWRSCGSASQPLPEQLDSTHAEGAVLVVETGRMSLAELDRRFIAPAVEGTRRGATTRVSILANDRCLAMSANARRKFWRRRRRALESLR